MSLYVYFIQNSVEIKILKIKQSYSELLYKIILTVLAKKFN